jgi:hypothetical protein
MGEALASVSFGNEWGAEGGEERAEGRDESWECKEKREARVVVPREGGAT